MFILKIGQVHFAFHPAKLCSYAHDIEIAKRIITKYLKSVALYTASVIQEEFSAFWCDNTRGEC